MTLAVREKTREILWFDVAKMAAKGPLKKIGASLYGWTASDAKDSFKRVVEKACWASKGKVTFKTDKYPAYPKWIAQSATGSWTHVSIKARKHKTGTPKPFDPLFSINRVAASLRKNLATFARRSTVVAKTIEMIEARLWVFLAQNNGYRLA